MNKKIKIKIKMGEQEIKNKLEEIEDSILDFNRGSRGLLKHSEVYFILDL